MDMLYSLSYSLICVIKKPDDMVFCHVAHFGYPFGSLTDTQDKRILVVIWPIYIYIYICKMVWCHLKQIFGGWLCDCLFCCRDISKHGGLLGVLIFLIFPPPPPPPPPPTHTHTHTHTWGWGGVFWGVGVGGVHSILSVCDVSETWCGDLIWFMT